MNGGSNATFLYLMVLTMFDIIVMALHWPIIVSIVLRCRIQFELLVHFVFFLSSLSFNFYRKVFFIFNDTIFAWI
jgi:hypothetical protein